MAKKKKQPAEFRFYELPQDEPVLALMGNKWIQVYGENIDNQHFQDYAIMGKEIWYWKRISTGLHRE